MTLPRPADSNGLVCVKLKRKVEYRNHLLFGSFRPSFVESFLMFLKQFLKIILELNITEKDAASNSAPQLEKGQNPLSAFQSQSTGTTVTTETPCNTDIEEAIAVAPGNGKTPISLLADEYCEEMAHPHLFQYSNYGYKAERHIPHTICQANISVKTTEYFTSVCSRQ